MEKKRLRVRRAAQSGIATAGAITRAFFTKRRFPFLLIGAFAIAGVTIWADRSIVGAVRGQLQSHLKTILDAEVEALEAWQKTEAAQARAVASDADVRQAAAALLAADGDLKPRRTALAEALKEPMRSLGYGEFVLLGRAARGFRVVAASRSEWLERVFEQGYLHEVAAQVLTSGAGRVTRPAPSAVPRPDAGGELKVGMPQMAVATPVVARAESPPAGVLLFGVEPRQDFTRILQLASFGESGETYAFDARGLLLSQSRFDDELRKLGLMPDRPGVTSILNVHVRNPGVDLTKGKKPKVPIDQQPLTRAAKAAIAKGDGTDVKGYRDYRGVVVVGAWRWLDGMGIGIVTEVDYAEAYAPLVKLRIAFGALVGLLIAAGVGVLAFMWVAARYDVARRKAEREVAAMGQYTLEEKLGQGGMGTVYKARHALLARPTAVKILDPPGENGEEAIKRFEREVQATAKLVNPHTIRIYDYGSTADGRFYYAMEYVDGLSLTDLLEVNGGRLGAPRTVRLLIQVCRSLAEAHAEGLVHRDMKPDNVLVTARGGMYDHIKVVDFGLVKELGGVDRSEVGLTQAGAIMGTPLYMPPEQVTGAEVCPTADVYSVGAMAYHLLTGVPPFFAKSVVQIFAMHVSDPPPPFPAEAEVPAPLAELVLACLAKKPSERPRDASDLLERLRALKLAGKWTEDDAKAWWTAHAEAIANPPQEKSKDPTGLAWLEPGPEAASPATTADVPPPT